MDTGAVAGKGDAIGGDEAVLEGRDKCGKPEELLEPFFIMEGKGLMAQGIIRQRVSDPGMFIRKLLPFARLFGRLFVLVRREKVLPAGFLGSLWLWPEPVHKVKVRAKRRKPGGNAADQNGKKAVGLEFFDPGGKAGKAKHQHEDKGADGLGLVFGGTAEWGIEAG